MYICIHAYTHIFVYTYIHIHIISFSATRVLGSSSVAPSPFFTSLFPFPQPHEYSGHHQPRLLPNNADSSFFENCLEKSPL